MITLLATIVVLGVLIFVHELGHLITAKLVHIEVPRFSIGFGPKLWGIRRGETEYVVAWFPLGGYVKMAGMEEMERVEGGTAQKTTGLALGSDAGLVTEAPRRPGPRDFEAKSLPARSLVISSGVLMNIAFAFVVFAASALVWGVRIVPEARIAAVLEDRLPAGAEPLATVPTGAQVSTIDGKRIDDWADLERTLAGTPPGPVVIAFRDAPAVTVRMPADDSLRAELIAALRPQWALEPVLGTVAPGSPADRAGLRPGDRIVEAAGTPVRRWEDLVRLVESRPGQTFGLVLERAGRRLSVQVTPEEQKVREGGRTRVVGRLGVASAVPRERPGPIGALAYGFDTTWGWITTTIGFVADLVTGDVSPRNLGGPILIGQVSGRVARAGLEAFLGFMAIFSINLAILNLLPIPVLDGGHLLFLAIEGVRGRALSLEQRVRLSQVGFVIVIAIMVWALANDVLRLFGL